tara:strand:- start:2754 stop:3149 length:396 start_codon:yes stop_codon:yes gene_type:complete
MEATFNPFGPTGGNPMVKVVEIAGIPYWSFYKAIFGNFPPHGVTFELYRPPINAPGFVNYNDAWNACKNFYMFGEEGSGYQMPGYTMDDVGLTLGNPQVPGFTFSDQGLAITAATPNIAVKVPPSSPPAGP